MSSDGSIRIDTKLNIGEAEKELNRLKQKILGLEEDLYLKKKHKSGIEQSLEDARKELESVQQRTSIENDRFVIDPADLERITALKEQISSLEGDLKKADSAIKQSEQSLEAQKEIYGEIEHKAAELREEAERRAEAEREAGDVGEESASRVSAAMDALGVRVEKFERRLIGLAKRVFVFTLITKALRGVREYFGNAIKTNDEATAAIARLKGALLTMVQPLIGVVIPAFTALVNVLTRIVTVIASLISALFGTTIQQSAAAAKGLYNEQKALKGVGSAAKSASKSLAAFDEINQLGDDSGSGGGSIAPTFEIGEADGALFNLIRDHILEIGAALAAWKLSDGLMSGFKTFLGLLIAAQGAITFIKGIFEAWVNGVSWSNLGKSIGGLIALSAGLALAFGPVAAGIALVIGGITMLVTAIKDILENGLTLENGIMAITGLLAICTGVALLTHASFLAIAGGMATVVAGIALLVIGFKDAIENGWNLENTLTALAGIILTGLGISLLVGSWIPALIAGILGILVAITTMTGNGGALIEGLKQVFNGLNTFISGAFTGDWKKAWEGVKNIFAGIWNTIVTLLESAANLIVDGINAVIKRINSVSFSAPDWVPGIGGQRFGFTISPLSRVTLPRIPALAEGAVIPANREFLAVLGDQTSGRNIEAPEALLRQMAQEAASANTELLQAILAAIREGHVIEVDHVKLGKTTRNAIRDNGRMGL